jgi:hypothetical protein
MSTRSHHLFVWLAIVAVGCLAVWNNYRIEALQTASEQAVYDRILGEVWTEVQPIYSEFELSVGTGARPQSFKEMLSPILSVVTELEPTE